jgi:hypothetical protein
MAVDGRPWVGTFVVHTSVSLLPVLYRQVPERRYSAALRGGLFCLLVYDPVLSPKEWGMSDLSSW